MSRVWLRAIFFYFLSSDEQEVERKNTRLLLGLCLDSRARYRTSSLRLQEASDDYQRALEICSQEQGPTHPQVPTQGHTGVRLYRCGSNPGPDDVIVMS